MTKVTKFKYPKKYGKLPGQIWRNTPAWEKPYFQLGNRRWEWSPGEIWQYIYFLYVPEVNRIKIGYSRNPLKRMDDIEFQSPCFMERTLLLCVSRHVAQDIEKTLHIAFRRYLHHGEWFDYTGKLKEFVEKLKKECSAVPNA